MLKEQGVGGGRKSGLRGEPHRHSEMKLCFLVILVDMAAKIVVRVLAGFEQVIFKYHLTATFAKASL